MGNKDSSIKQRLRAYLAGRQPSAITEPVWRELLAQLAPVSESYLRELLRDTGLPFEQPYAGIRQHTFDELEESLREMQRVYEDALAAKDRERARYCRRVVIAAKDRAKFQASKRSEKREMLEWMMVWLENPPLFSTWVEARKRVLGPAPCES